MKVDELRKQLDKIPEGGQNKARRAEIIRRIIEEQKREVKQNDHENRLPRFD